MKFRPFSLLIVLFCCAGLTAQTTAERAGERAKDRAENRANQRVDRTVDQAVDDAFNAVSNLFKKKKSGTQEAPSTSTSSRTGGSTAAGNEAYSDDGGISIFGNNDPWVPFTNSQSFSMTMEVTEIKKNGKRKVSIVDLGVTTNKVGMRMTDEGSKELSRMILNTQDGKTTIVTTEKNGQETGIRMRMPNMGKLMAEAAEDVNGRFSFTQTGERKTIDGYDCEKIIVKDNKKEIVTESWVTQDIGMDAQQLFGSISGMFGGGGNQGAASSLAGGYTGFPILAISKHKKSTYECRYQNIKIGENQMDKSVVSLVGVTVQNLGM